MRVTTLLRLPRTVRNVRRVREIVTVLFRHGFGELVAQLDLQPWVSWANRFLRRQTPDEAWMNQTTEVRIRTCLEDLGPTFVKLGQVLATRPDLIPMELILELRKLQDDVPPFPAEEARRVIAEDLGREIEEIFPHFDSTPLAAASIAQVHRARLDDGSEVVVKVQRPELGRVIERDLEIVRAFADLLAHKIPELRQFELPGIAAEFATALRTEADFTNERMNMERFVRLWEDDPMVDAPRSYPELSSRRVLTMEFIDGVKVTDLAGLAKLSVNPKEVAERGTQIALRSIFEHGFFHADPHPGNFFVLSGGQIRLIDFGVMGVIDRQRLDELLSFLVSILLGDPDMMVRLFLEMDIIEDKTDVRTLKREVRALLDRYTHVPIGEIDIGRFIQQVFVVVVKHQVRLPADLMLVGKAMTTMEGIAQEIYPAYDPVETMRPYLMRIYVMRILDPAHHARELAKQASDIALLIRQLPTEIRTLLKKARRGELRVVNATEDLDRLLTNEHRRMNRLIIAGLSATAMVVGSAFSITGHTTEATIFWSLAGMWLVWVWAGVIRPGGT